MRLFQPLARPPIARLWTGLSLSAVGDQLHRAAVSWLLVGLAGAQAGFFGAAEGAAVLGAALVVGVWAERWDHRRAMMAADLVRAGLASVPLLAAAAHRLDLWTLVVPALAMAALTAVFDPALQASLPRLAGERRALAQTNALMDATARIARLVGPALAGALSTVLPAVSLIGLNGASFLFSAVAVASLRRDLPAARANLAPSRLENLSRGVRAVRACPPFGLLLVRSAMVNGLWVVAIWFALPLVVRAKGLSGFGASGLAVVGLVMGSYGAGNLASNLLISQLELRRPLRLMVAGNAVVGLGLVLMGLAAGGAPAAAVPLLMAAAAFTALGGPITDIPMATLRQTAFRTEDLAAVYRVFLVADWTGMLVATAVSPLALKTVGPAGLMVLCGAGVVLAAAATALRLKRRASTSLIGEIA